MGSGYQIIDPKLPMVPDELAEIRDHVRNYLYNQVGWGLGRFGSAVQDVEHPWTSTFLTDKPAVYDYAMDKFTDLLNYAVPYSMAALSNAINAMVLSGTPGSLDAAPPIFSVVDTTLDAMLPTGLPADLDSRYTTTLAQVQEQLDDELVTRMAEKNVTGGRYSSGAAYAVALATAKAIKDWGATRSAEALSAVETARQRRLTGSQLGVALGEALDARQFAELTSWDNAQHRRILAFQWWMNLFRLPLDTASAAANAAMGEWQIETTAVQNEWHAWVAKQPQTNPALQMGYGYAVGYPFSAQAPQVAESPWLGMLKGVIGAVGSVAGAMKSAAMLGAA